MSKRRRRNHGGSHENHERWLITYSDLITLLMIFFVIMYAMSQIDQSKFDSLSISLQKALHPSNQIQMNNLGTSGIISMRPESNQKNSTNNQDHKTDPNNSKDSQAQANAQAEQQQLDKLMQQIQQYINQQKLAGMINVLDTAQGVQITLNDAALFDSGSAELKPTAKYLLGGLAPFLKILPNQVQVEGHTDNRPINNAQFPSNWELSTQRAVNVLHYFESAGLQHDRLSAIGYADTRPLAPNDTDAHRAENRRVNLIVLRKYPQPSISPLDKNNVINTSGLIQP